MIPFSFFLFYFPLFYFALSFLYFIFSSLISYYFSLLIPTTRRRFSFIAVRCSKGASSVASGVVSATGRGRTSAPPSGVVLATDVVSATGHGLGRCLGLGSGGHVPARPLVSVFSTPVSSATSDRGHLLRALWPSSSASIVFRCTHAYTRGKSAQDPHIW